jgi:sulfopyruvate decarboxylase subunit beta
VTRAEAIAAVLALLGEGELVVAANGMIGREAFAARDRPESFYMIGSMGLAGAIGLGVALAQPRRRVVVLDGDGNVLMGLGGLAMVAERQPANFLHVVLDNESYGSTGGQRSISDRVPLAAVAAAAGYAQAREVADEAALAAAVRELLAAPGPSFLLAKIAAGDVPDRPGAPRVAHDPEAIARRFRRAAGGEAP